MTWLKPGENREAAQQEIYRYLVGQGRDLSTGLPDPRWSPERPLSSRDYWALVLADLTGIQIDLTITDSPVASQEKIADLLAKVKTRWRVTE